MAKIEIGMAEGGGENARAKSYGQILKSSAVVGGASVMSIGFGIIRTKVVAMWLGPAGVGVAGLYESVVSTTLSVAGMGIQASGVRQIAEAAGSNDEVRIECLKATLRRMSVVLGVVAACFLFVFSKQISMLTFGSESQRWAVEVLSCAVLFRAYSSGQFAILQGLRRISSLASLNIFGAFAGMSVSIPIIYIWGQAGLAPAVVVVSGISMLAALWVSRRLDCAAKVISVRETFHHARGLLKLGLAFMASGVLTMGAAYVVRVMLVSELGYAAVGLYQSAWALGGLYVGFILDAMGADFYPRLTGIAKDHVACNRLVNEQVQVSLLLAGPGVLGTLSLAPWVVELFYSSRFQGADSILRWICLGMALRVLAWPMGFIVLAKDAQKIFFWTEVLATAVHLGLAWVGIKWFGTVGAGAAFFGLYVWHGVLVYWIVRRLTGFRFSRASLKVIWVYLPLLVLVFASQWFLPSAAALLVGLAGTLFCSFNTVRILASSLSNDQLPPKVRRIVACLRLRVGTWQKEIV